MAPLNLYCSHVDARIRPLCFIKHRMVFNCSFKLKCHTHTFIHLWMIIYILYEVIIQYDNRSAFETLIRKAVDVLAGQDMRCFVVVRFSTYILSPMKAIIYYIAIFILLERRFHVIFTSFSSSIKVRYL